MLINFLRIDMVSRVKLMSALEEIRVRKENYDTVALFSTFRWLNNYLNITHLNTAELDVLVEIAERYAQAVLTSLAHTPSSKIVDSIFTSPYVDVSTTVEEDDIISEEVIIFLARQSICRKEFREAETYLSSTLDTAHDMNVIRNAFYEVLNSIEVFIYHFSFI